VGRWVDGEGMAGEGKEGQKEGRNGGKEERKCGLVKVVEDVDV